MSDNKATVSISSSQFETLIQENDLIFIDFWAEWCAPCKHFSHVYEKVAALNQDIVFAKVNIEQEGDLAESFQIRSIPHLMVFKQGIIIYSESGSIPESTLKELVDQAKDADVSEIKARLDTGLLTDE